VRRRSGTDLIHSSTARGYSAPTYGYIFRFQEKSILHHKSAPPGVQVPLYQVKPMVFSGGTNTFPCTLRAPRGSKWCPRPGETQVFCVNCAPVQAGAQLFQNRDQNRPKIGTRIGPGGFYHDRARFHSFCDCLWVRSGVFYMVLGTIFGNILAARALKNVARESSIMIEPVLVIFWAPIGV